MNTTLNDRISDAIARWLSHPSGIAQATVITAAWFATPPLFGWRETVAIFWYLAYCTFVSYVTQFTLSYQNKKTEQHMLKLMRLQLTMAEQLSIGQVEQDKELDESQERLEKLVALAERATRIRELREAMLRREEHIHLVHGLVKALIAGLEGDGELPRSTRQHIYSQIEAEFMAWAYDREKAEGLLQDMGVSVTEETDAAVQT